MTLYHYLIWTEFGLAAITFISLFFISAPYGRFVRPGWGVTIKAKLGWFIMELPAVLVMSYFFFTGDTQNPVNIAMIIIWLTHYLHRTFVYPFRQSGSNKQFPLLLVVLAITFNLINGYVNGTEVFHLKTYDTSWFFSAPFRIGLAIFIIGFSINKYAEYQLRNLRKPGETGYKIPQGGLFELISSPHYFGEIIEWTGWAILTGSVAGWAFVAYTFANLAPRAIAHHRWYKENFSDYPAGRKALIPYLW
jgi:protein-S-isoprenylcysteine O-methyltransferase Ste14